MSDWLDWIDQKIIWPLVKFLKTYFYPFATPFFAILNYDKMKKIFEKLKHPGWAKFSLILTIVYVLFSLGFGIYWVISGESVPAS